MGAREDLLTAARSLTDRGLHAFFPAQLIAEARAFGSTYPDTTLRTFIVGPMCVNSPNHHAVQYADLERIARGLYRLRGQSAATARDVDETVVDPSESTPGTSDVGPITSEPTPAEPRDEWFWEGNIQAAVVSHLAATGWRILRVAGTSSREHGIDIEADRHDERILVEVKGYPGSTYTRGERQGSAKATSAPAQARTYFGNAVLSGLLMRSDGADARAVLAFPDVPTFSNLARRVVAPLADAGIEVWLVSAAGAITETGAR